MNRRRTLPTRAANERANRTIESNIDFTAPVRSVAQANAAAKIKVAVAAPNIAIAERKYEN